MAKDEGMGILDQFFSYGRCLLCHTACKMRVHFFCRICGHPFAEENAAEKQGVFKRGIMESAPAGLIRGKDEIFL